MSSSVTVRSYTPQAIKANTSGAESGILETLINVSAQAKALAPVDSGQLKGSIGWKTATASTTDLSESVTALSGVVGTNKEYAVYQEYGTRNMTAQPFLQPAVSIVTNGTGFDQAMADAMANSVKEVLGRG